MQHDIVRILLADDDEDDRLLFQEAFEELKMQTEVTTVIDGVALMNYLSEKTADQLPQLLFLDLNMPRKNGMECLKEIKQDDRYKDIAIAIYSTSSSDQDIEQTFVNGANVYLKKPNDFSKLKKILSEVVTVNWQYQTSGLNRDNFILNL